MARPISGPLVFIVVLASFAAACSAAGAPSGSTPTASSTSASASPSGSALGPGDSVTRPSFPAVSIPIASPGVAIELPATVLDPVLADAAQRSGVPREQIVVVTAVATTWPDGSLGCRAPGQMYTQALVEGWQVVVRAGTTLYDYRGAGVTTFKLCKTVPG
jgi:hypothetical protein